jgi:hypothetical protein
MAHKTSKLDKALSYLQEKHSAEWCAEYGEPGYTNPDKGIIFANWNDIPNGLADWLEKCGYELEWSDEWMIDYSYGKAYRTSADSYQWECLVHLRDDGEYLTPDDSADDWIEALAIDNPKARIGILPSRITPDDLQAAGFVLHADKQESGFHAGQTDNPQTVAADVFANHRAGRAVFRRIEASQFYSVWQCWIEVDTSKPDSMGRIWEAFEYTICGAYVPSLINGDSSGLEDSEDVAFDEWQRAQESHATDSGFTVSHWDCADSDDEDITHCDVTGLLAQCATVRLHCYKQT